MTYKTPSIDQGNYNLNLTAGITARQCVGKGGGWE